MSKSNTVTINVNAGGNTVLVSRSFHSDFAAENSPDEVAAYAKTGSLTTRTLDTTGIITSTAHGIDALSVISIFWDGGYRVDVDADSVDANTISFSGGAGDNLPIEDTVCYVSVRLQVDTLFDGANLSLLCLSADQSFLVSVLNSVDTSVINAERNSGDAYLWYSESGDNPLSAVSEVAAVNFYNRSLTTDANVSAIYSYDNTLDQV